MGERGRQRGEKETRKEDGKVRESERERDQQSMWGCEKDVKKEKYLMERVRERMHEREGDYQFARES